MAQIQKVTTEFDVNYKDWEQFEDELRRVEKTYGRTEKEIVQGNRKIERSLERTGKKGKDSIGGIGKAWGNFQSVVLGGAIFAGFQQLLGAFNQLKAESIALFDAQAKADAQLRAALKSTGEISGRTFEDLKTQASELQDISLFGDEQVQGAQSVLLTFTNIRDEIFDRTVPAILDVSQALGKDLQSSAIQVGKALNDPVKGVTALAESGIQFTDQQRELIKSLVDTGRTAEAQTLILKELETQFGGSAAAAAEAGSGGIQQLENRINDLKEEIGEELLPIQEALTHAEYEFVSALLEAGRAVQQYITENEDLQEIVVLLKEDFALIQDALDGVTESSKNIGIELGFVKTFVRDLNILLKGVRSIKETANSVKDFFGLRDTALLEELERAKEQIQDVGDAADQLGINDNLIFTQDEAELAEQYKATMAAVVAEQTAISAARAKDIQSLNAEINALKMRAEILQASAEERIQIQQQREIAELEQSKAFQKLKAEDEEAAQALIDEIRVKYALLESDRKAAELEAERKLSEDLLANERMLVDEKEAIRQEEFANKQARILRDAAEETLLATQKLETEKELQAALEQIEIERLEQMIELRKEFGMETLELDQEFAEKRREKRLAASADTTETEKELINDFTSNLQTVLSTSARFFQEITRARLQAAGDDEEKIKQIRREEFARNQALALAEVAINTAVAITAALKNPATAPFVIPLLTGIGLAQATAIASQEPPVFHEGTDFATAEGGNSREFYAKMERGERVIDADTNATYKTDLDAVHDAVKNRRLRAGELAQFVTNSNMQPLVQNVVEIDYKKLAREVAQANKLEQVATFEEVVSAIQANNIDMAELAKTIKWAR